MAGAVAAGFVGERSWLPAFSLVPLMILGAAAAGALWALLPALLKVRLKVDDVVTTLLLNSIMLYGVMALLEGPWKDPRGGYPNSPSIRPGGRVPDPRRLRAPSRRLRRRSSRRSSSGGR